MSFPDIDPEEVGLTGLFWLLASYGYVLFIASNLISGGSELLTLIPSVSGIVGSVVLPLLGAVPDGAIMLFSGLGDIETAQETLSVGVGALAGSTIMLLTVPWSFSIIFGRVKIGRNNKPDYTQPKLNPDAGICESLFKTGVPMAEAIKHSAIIMALTTIPYFLIQIPCTYYEGKMVNLASAEKEYAFIGFIICIIGFVGYLGFQFKVSHKEEAKQRRVAVMKKLISSGNVSLKATMYNRPTVASDIISETTPINTSYEGGSGGPIGVPSRQTSFMENYMYDVLADQFRSFDHDKNGYLDLNEVILMLRSFGMDIDKKAAQEVFKFIDEDNNGKLSLAEIVKAGCIFVHDENYTLKGNNVIPPQHHSEEDDDDEEVEDLPESISSLPPDQQQKAIVKKAMGMLALGTGLVLLFSDPMVDVLNALANRFGIPPFYVSFALAPIAANLSEFVSSLYYASKKTTKSIVVSLTQLEGAASMNNTFCLSILLGLIYFRKLAWAYTAETITIVTVQLIMVFITRKSYMTLFDALVVLMLFPLSIVFVAALEHYGFD